MEENKIKGFEVLFSAFKRDPRSALMALMALAIAFLYYQNAGLQEKLLNRSDEYKAEIVREIKRAYDPKFEQIKDTVISKSNRLDTTIQEVNNFIINANTKLEKKK